jgi:hypothetical protein
VGYRPRPLSFGRGSAQVQVKGFQSLLVSAGTHLKLPLVNLSTGAQHCFLTASILFHSGFRKVRIPTVSPLFTLTNSRRVVDTDILKPDTGSVPFERRSGPPSKLQSTEGSSGIQTPDRRSTGQQYTEPVSEGEEDEEMDLAPARDERQRTGISGRELDEAIAYREKTLRENPRDGGSDSGQGTSGKTSFLKNRDPSAVPPVKPRALSIDPLAPSQAFYQTLRERLGNELGRGPTGTTNGDETPHDEVEEALRSDERILSRDFTAPKGKRVAVPVRVEPKVYFASERTFLVCIPFQRRIPRDASLNHFFYRNGSTSQSTSERSPQLSSTSSNQATRTV